MDPPLKKFQGRVSSKSNTVALIDVSYNSNNDSFNPNESLTDYINKKIHDIEKKQNTQSVINSSHIINYES